MGISKYFDAEYDGWSFNTYFRRKRSKLLLNIIDDAFQQNGKVTILDIGGTKNYWKIIEEDFLRQRNVKIVCLNSEHPVQKNETGYDNFTMITHDATANIWETLDIKSFDILHSNSVLEHVGDWSKMRKFAANIVMFKGAHFIQTPYFWFFLEPHWITPFFHFLPRPVRVWLVLNFSLGHQKKARTINEAVEQVESARLLDRKMMRALFPNSVIIDEKVAFLTKSLIATHRN